MEDPKAEVRSLLIRMREHLGYENVVDLKKAYDELSPKDKEDMVRMFNDSGIPTK